jgi:ATP-dependent DNA ligase
MREGDFVATDFEYGKGRNSKVVGALNLSAYDKTGIRNSVHLVSLGNVGTGFDDVTRKAALKWTYPCVVEVKYEKMSETGLRFPSFLRKRDDKKPRECIL